MAGLAAGSELGRAAGPWAVAPLAVLVLLAPAALLVHRRAGSVLLLAAALASLGCLRAVAAATVDPVDAGPPLSRQTIRGRVHAVQTGSFAGRGAWARLELEVVARDGSGSGPAPGEGIRLSIGRSEGGWEIGDLVSVRAEPRRARGFCNGGRDGWTRWLARRGVVWTAWVRDDAAVRRLEPGAVRSLSEAFVRARGRVGAMIDRTVHDPAAAVLRALVIGDKGRLSPSLRDAFARTGTSHLLAVSGMHLALVTAFAFVVVGWILAGLGARATGRPRAVVAAPLSLIAAAGYAGLTGGAVSTARALVMASFVAGGLALRRRLSPVTSLVGAAGVLLAGDPEVLRDLSFQLSFVSVAAILGVAARMHGTPLGRAALPERGSGRLRRFAAWILGAALVSAAASTATAPLTAHAFGQVSLVSVPANLLVGPLLGMGALGLGLLGAAATLAHLDAAGGLLFAVAGAAIDGAVALVEPMSAWRWAAIAIDLSRPSLVLAILLAMAAAVLPGGGARRLVGLSAAVLLLLPVALTRPPGVLRLSVLDVGQGDGLILASRSGSAWVIDAGGLGGDFDTGEGVVLPALQARPALSLRGAILSHAQRDHYGGLAAVITRSGPREFWWNERGSDARGFAGLLEVVEAEGVRLRPAGARTRLSGAASEMELLAVHPPPRNASMSANDASLVVAARYGATRVLLTGDVEARGERILLRSGADLSATVLKVAHHGSRSSSLESFLARARPALSVASLGRFNRFGFPAPEVVERHRRFGARWRTTGDYGEVEVTSDGQIERVETCRSEDGE